MSPFSTFRTVLCLGFAMLECASAGQLTPAERKGLADAMFVGNLTSRDLEFPRRPFDSPERLPTVDLAIERPLEAADFIMGVHARAGEPLPALLEACDSLLRGGPRSYGRGGEPFIALPGQVPVALRRPLVELVVAMSRTQTHVEASLQGLSPAERRTLIEGLPRLAWDQAKFEFVSRPMPSRDELLALAERVDLPRIRSAAVFLAREIERLLPTLRSAADASDFRGRVTFRAAGLRVVLAGHGDDLHTERDANLTLDLGGDDRYVGRHGAGPGYASVLLDLGGDDEFRVGDFNLGAGLIGIGLAYDLGGHDSFRTGSLCLGAGLGGVGGFYKEGGNDQYASATGAQGFGILGVGTFVDTSGDDTYRAELLAQGAGLTGGVGWCVDRGGDDTYRAGGRYPATPLFSDVDYSMAQGYGAGIREDTGGVAGGIGLLTDLSGSDAYVGETYCQAASYWFGLGSLYDASGHDAYRAYHYAQASAMHLSAAYLFDLAGDDVYGVSFGAAHAIGHDFGVAFLLDRAGDDVYAARDSRPGLGGANGLGIFLEADGEDRYMGPPGSAFPARGTGSLGIFADLNGPDKYTEGLSDGAVRVADVWGVALDAESRLTKPSESEPVVPLPKPGSRPIPPDTEIAELFARASRWAVGTAQREAAEAIAGLIEIGTPALNWMIAHKLESASRLEQRVFVRVADALGESGRAAVAQKIASERLGEARAALEVCLDGAFREAEPFLGAALGKLELARPAARLAGLLKSAAYLEDLMALCASKDRLAALYALVALRQIGNPQSVGTGQGFLTSWDLPLRKAAIELVALFPEQALQSGTLLADSGLEREARIGLELLGKVGTPEALERIAKGLSDARAGVRIQALLELDGRCPAPHRSALLMARQDPDPRVRAVASRITPGR